MEAITHLVLDYRKDLLVKRKSLAIISICYIPELDFFFNKDPDFGMIYRRDSEVLHSQVEYISDFLIGFPALADIRHIVKHKRTDDLGHAFIDEEKPELTKIVAESIGRMPTEDEVHYGTERKLECQYLLHNPGAPRMIRRSLLRAMPAARPLSMMLSSYFQQQGSYVSPRSFERHILFAMGFAYKRMKHKGYIYHYSNYTPQKKEPSLFERMIFFLLHQSPRASFFVGMNYNELKDDTPISDYGNEHLAGRFAEYLGDHGHESICKRQPAPLRSAKSSRIISNYA